MEMADVKSIAKESIHWSIGLSIVLILLGLAALMIPLAAGVAANLVVAWLLMLGGFGHLFFAWHVRGAGGHLWETLVGLAYLSVGMFMLVHPLLGLLSLTFVLGCYLLVKGIAEIVLGFQLKPMSGSGWLFFDGAISVVLAGFIYWRLPYAAEWLVGTYIGITILFSGVSRLMLSMAAKRGIATI
jgi:uncharacterized membrane protein HdeD (DUF308 family)